MERGAVFKGLTPEETGDRFKSLGFDEYIEAIISDSKVTRNAFQRLYDMIMHYGSTKYKLYGKEAVHYHFLDDPFFGSKNAIYGLDFPMMRFMKVLNSAALAYGQEKRIIVILGPVGSCKSTFVDLLKKGMEDYSRMPEGRLYGLVWYADKDEVARNILGLLKDNPSDSFQCELHEDPINLLRLLKEEGLIKEDPFRELNQKIKGNFEGNFDIKSWCSPCPKCRYFFLEFLRYYHGDWKKIFENHVQVERVIISEKNRVGIGTFKPKHEKDQDAAELEGDLNYRLVAVYGKESDPRTFAFDGEFQVANRGIMEFEEVYKLATAFLYSLLGASQEHRIKARKFSQIDIDEVIICHTNEPEYEKVVADCTMEALKDRTTVIKFPYVVKLSEEKKIYGRDYGAHKIKTKHQCPHVIDVVAMASIISRCEEPKKFTLDLTQMMKLLDSQEVKNFSEETVKEILAAYPTLGMKGISPRFNQDMIANALIDPEKSCINPFMVLNELQGGLASYCEAHQIPQARQEHYREAIKLAEKEYEAIIREEYEKAIGGDIAALQKLCSSYLDNITAFLRDKKVKDKFSGKEVLSDEALMRSIEEPIGVNESGKVEFRKSIIQHMGFLALQGKTFTYDSNDEFHNGLRRKLFNEQKDLIRFSSLCEGAVRDPETEARLNALKERLKTMFGYCDEGARGVISYISAIYAREEKEGK